MSSLIVRVLPRTQFDWSSLASGSFDFVVAKGIDIAQGTSVVLVTRLHAITVSGGSGNWTVNVTAKGDAPTPEDPSNEWNDAIGNYAQQVISTAAGSIKAAGDIGRIAFATPIGGHSKLVITPTQSSPTKEATFKFTISADYVIKW